MSIEVLRRAMIEEALEENKRQYLLGNLVVPQDLMEILDNNVEAGISKYKEYVVETPHYHSYCTEYQYVLFEAAKYMDLNTNHVYVVSKGDFFVIRPMTKYYQKAREGTEILFFQSTGRK